MKNITFINAGAGSGKTYRLTEILVDWVKLNKDQASKVMLTTFTKKAAAEIKERTQSKLLEKKLFREANELQNAFIGTVHSVGYQFIKKYWYLLGISPELNEIGENEKDIFFSQAIASIPENEELNQLNKFCYDFNFQSYNGDYTAFNPLKWKDDVIDIMNKALTNNINLEDNTSIEISKKKINGLFKTSSKNLQLNEIIDQVDSVLKTQGAPKPYQNALENWAILKNKLLTEELNLKFVFEMCKLISNLKKEVYKADKYSELRNLIPLLSPEDFDVFKSTSITYTELIFDIAKRSLVQYKQFKQEKGLVDYTDMEVYFLQLLDYEPVKEELKESLKLVMVDEFQDSNPIQLSIFMKLSDLTEQSYWVGDPKQAIYGFRGTDPVLIDQVIHEFTKVNKQNLKIEFLKMSWRSTPNLVDLSNKIFEPRMKDQMAGVRLLDRDQLQGDTTIKAFTDWKDQVEINPLKAIETIGLIAARDENDFTTVGSNIKFWSFNADAAKGIKAFTGEHYVEKFSNKVKQILKDGKEAKIKIFDMKTNRERALNESDICILIRSNHNVDKIAAQLKKDGIPVNAEVDGLTKTLEYRMLYNIVSLFVNKNSALSNTELAYLCGEEKNLNHLIEKRLEFVIQLLIENEKDENFDFYNKLSEWLKEAPHLTLINTLRKQSKRLSVSQIIQLIINQFNVFQKLLNFDNSTLRMANILKLNELSKEYETYCVSMNLGSGLAGFFNFIELNKEHKKQAKTTDGSAVNVMTYHKAKGLEWPVVILTDLHDNPLGDTSFYIKEYFKTKVINTSTIEINEPLNNRTIEFSFWPYGTDKSVNESLKEIIDDREDYKSHYEVVRNEASRLLYVGITRARDYLFFTTNQVKELNGLTNILPEWDFENERALKGLDTMSFSQLDLFNINVAIDFESIKPEDEIKNTFEHVDERREIYFQKQIPNEQNKPYYLNPSKVEPAKNVKITVKIKLHERLKTRAKNAAELGDSLHQALFLKDRSYFEEAVNEMAALKRLGVDKECFIKNIKIFNTYLEDEFKPIKQYSEYYIEQMLENQLVVGEADLVLETETGLILIDYKSYSGTDDVATSSCEYYAGKYSGQLNLYSQMLENTFNPKKVIKKLIYYVVQGTIVELN